MIALMLVLLIAASAFANEPPARSSALVLIARAAAAGLDQAEIYEILCGGKVVRDPRLSDHLWTVAGSLAEKAWTPPEMTIHVVVSEPAKR